MQMLVTILARSDPALASGAAVTQVTRPSGRVARHLASATTSVRTADSHG